MRSILRAVGALLLLSLWAQIVSAQELGPLPDGAEPITDQQALHDLLYGATLYGSFPQYEGDRWSEYYCRNGKAIYVMNSEVESGRWWIDAPEACFAYERPDEISRICFLTYRLSTGRYFMRSEARQLDVLILGRLDGDPFNIQRLKGMACEDLSS